MLGEFIESLRSKADIVVGAQTTSEGSTADGCAGEYGLTEDTVIFYHADWCPHCKKMIPVVEELEAEGYNFHLAETTSGEGVDVVDACFKDVLQGGVPQFICAGSKEYKMGSMNKAALKAFADSC